MTDRSKRNADRSQPGKPVRPADSPLGETARASDSEPVPVGPFATLPTQFGRYEIRKELGRGQMGAVYLAYDVELDRLVALKVARVSASGSAKLLKRMEIEAKSAAKVDHPQICKVYDAGEIDGIRFIALQYIDGEDLKQYLKRLGRKREPGEAVRLIVQILCALEAAHEQGVIHRDLKPENIMLNKKSQPVIMDFGLARKTIASSDAGLTQGMIVGTAAYMSPEQATGKAEGIDHRSDLYAVGVMLFEMLTGEWPFTGGAIEVMGKKSVQEPPSPLTLNPVLNPQLAAACHKMIAKQKGDRYITCAEVVEALEEIDLTRSVQSSVASESVASEMQAKPKPSPVAAIEIPPLPLVSVAENRANIKRKKQTATPLAGVFARYSKWFRETSVSVRWLIGSLAALLVLLPAFLWWSWSANGIVQIVIDDPTLSVRFRGSSITQENDSQPIRVSTSARNPLEVFQKGIPVESAITELQLTAGERRRIKVSLVDGLDVVITDHSSKKNSSDESPRIGYSPRIVSKSTGMEFALIPAGELEMGAPDSEIGHSGDECPQHRVRITQPFYLGIYEVTQGEYQKITGWNPSFFSNDGGGKNKVVDMDTSRLPVERVSWYEAVEFCNRLSESEGRPAYYHWANTTRKNGVIETATVTISGGTGYRLPTEAEWEYACRAGSTTPFEFGNALNGEQANVDGRSPYGDVKPGPQLQRTTKVGSYRKNRFGLFDMHGNVSEWCEDCYEWSTYVSRSGTTDNPFYTSTWDSRVVRGGSWFSDPQQTRSAHRSGFNRRSQTDITGFRIARSVSKK
jgi:formylglycine-generating enzyme required for sulfatase activity/predicted Ser/Thr protein kinase